jgi:methylenetetrahydrofolate dehydrogenase (NADP+)/methenyltetrahydrofolate cyclohydrolase
MSDKGNIIDGKALSNEIKNEIREEVSKLVSNGFRAPHLAAVLVGENPASQSYVRSKVRSCEQVGFSSTLIQKEANITQDELLKVVQDLNQDPEIDGFIVQLPLPKQIDEMAITMAIDPSKDVDGFHPVNLGKMSLGLECFLPATPYGIMQMLERYGVETSGKQCVIIGRSNIVGTPMSILMSRKSKVGNATVTLTHSRTKDMKEELLRADIIIAAIGYPNFVTPDMIKEGAVVIDVGINRVDDPEAKRGYRLVGDVDFEGCKSKCQWITPVPGGVGPMTVTSLLMNTLKARKF